MKNQRTNPVLPRLNDKRTEVSVPQSQMFDIKASFVEYRKQNPGEPTYDSSQGDGGASLPGVPQHILQWAYKALLSNGTGYGKPAGSEAYRKAVVEDYWQSKYLSPENVVSCCGGRDALLKAYAAVQYLSGTEGGFILVSQVPWISYKWGPYMVGSNTLCATGDEYNSWAITKDSITESVRYAAYCGKRVSCLVITSPDNPTGRYTSLEEQVGLIRHAFSKGIPYVLCDWIYHWVSDYGPYDLNKFYSYFTGCERDRIIVMDGLTKSLGASNIRNAHLLASVEVCNTIARRASHGVIPGFYGEAVAYCAYKAGFQEVSRHTTKPISESREIVKSFLDKHRIRAIVDQGYYAFIDVEEWLLKECMSSSSELGIWLARHHGFAIVPGSYFHEVASNWIRFSYALPPEETKRNLEKLYSLWNK